MACYNRLIIIEVIEQLYEQLDQTTTAIGIGMEMLNDKLNALETHINCEK
jgi:uncharacterized Fe-S cluster-containing MiaB family protein